MTHRIMVVDDETPSREELAFIISNFIKPAEIYEADGGEKAIEIARKNNIEAAFIDVNMPGMDGISLSKELNRLDKNIKIVFATAYDLYAVKAFEMNAVDYILKPFEEQRVKLAIDKLFKNEKNNEKLLSDESKPEKMQGKRLNKISLWKGDRVIFVDIGDIVYIEAEEKNTLIKTRDGEYHSSQSISSLEEKLKYEGFFRIHRSYLINLEHVKEVQPWFSGGYIVKMQGYEKTDIPVSRKQIKEFKDILGF